MKMIVLMGLPGSGKSTICNKWFPTYTRINQDLLGTRDICIKECRLALERKKDVIIDRTNITTQQRKYWIDLGLEYGAESITCIFLDVYDEECIARIHERKDHPTISTDMPLDAKRTIVYKFNEELEYPRLEEGFSNVIFTRN